jgi:DNA-directed RNA polymerase subunit RPC12/RpoP
MNTKTIGGKENMKTNVGIDYGMGLTNRDKETGIHYGVISQNEVIEAWMEESEQGLLYACPYCGEEVNDIPDDDGNELACEHCGKASDHEEWYADSGTYFFEDSQYKAQAGNDGDIFITKSPYYTLCALCSPCAPGAGYLMDTRRPDGIKAYAFGHDWFENGKAPYPVYSVKTGKLVKPE